MAYFILGHGFESIEDERQEMPEGTYLVAAAECGRTTTGVEVDEIINELLKNPDVAKTPEAFPEAIRRRLRIYSPGMEYPNVLVSPLVYFDVKNERDTNVIQKSGVFPIPLPFEDLDVGKVKIKYGSYVDNSDGILEKAYEGSLVGPPLQEIKATYGNDLPMMLLGEPISIQTIFSKLGKGIYYFPICRSVAPPEDFELREMYRTLPKSVNTHDSLAVATYMLDHVADPKLKRKLQKQIFTINTIRARSTLRQRGLGKRRRTRKRKAGSRRRV